MIQSGRRHTEQSWAPDSGARINNLMRRIWLLGARASFSNGLLLLLVYMQMSTSCRGAELAAWLAGQ